VDVGKVADVSEVHSVSIFMVEDGRHVPPKRDEIAKIHSM
jgi:hypothetical protein